MNTPKEKNISSKLKNQEETDNVNMNICNLTSNVLHQTINILSLNKKEIQSVRKEFISLEGKENTQDIISLGKLLLNFYAKADYSQTGYVSSGLTGSIERKIKLYQSKQNIINEENAELEYQKFGERYLLLEDDDYEGKRDIVLAAISHLNQFKNHVQNYEKRIQNKTKHLKIFEWKIYLKNYLKHSERKYSESMRGFEYTRGRIESISVIKFLTENKDELENIDIEKEVHLWEERKAFCSKYTELEIDINELEDNFEQQMGTYDELIKIGIKLITNLKQIGNIERYNYYYDDILKLEKDLISMNHNEKISTLGEALDILGLAINDYTLEKIDHNYQSLALKSNTNNELIKLVLARLFLINHHI